MSRSRGMLASTVVWLTLLALLAVLGSLAASTGAAGLGDDGGAEWRVEQPPPPASPPEVEGLSTPIGLGRIGDVEFWAPNRGALITAGNGSTIPPGVWLYDGESWRELATVCGATDGRIAWAGPDEFWTVSDGRPGQAVANPSEQPPLQDNTLCRFAPGASGKLEVVASYASPAFLSTSYRAMHAAACLEPTDCWFAGEALENPQIGAFHLHWNGHALEPEPYLPEGHAVWSMRPFEGRLYEGVRLLSSDRVTKVSRHPPGLHLINGEGAQRTFETVSELPLYGEGEFFSALDFLHLSAAEGSLWGAAGPELENPVGSQPAGVTIIRKAAGGATFSQVLGPATEPSGLASFPEDVVDSIAAEPQTESAWIALNAKEDAKRSEPSLGVPAAVARITANGAVSDVLGLPSSGEPYGDKGAAEQIACPAIHDCWLATTHGWLLHLATQTEVQASKEGLTKDADPVFSDEEPITVRPPDQGLPSPPLDAPPIDDSGLEETPPPPSARLIETAPENRFATVTLPLLSHVHSRLVHATTLELSFHLAVKARVRLIAKHRRSVVASTPTRILKAGNRSLRLHLSPARWPTKLELQTHALAPLPTASTRENTTGSVTTSLAFPNALGPLGLGLAR